MRLSLNGWPPVASHLTCVLVGMSIAHLSRSEPEARVSLPPRAVVMAAPPGLLPRTLPHGAKVHVLRASPRVAGASTTCRLSRTPLTVLQPQSWLMLPLTELTGLAAALQRLGSSKRQRAEVSFADARTAVNVPLCRAAAAVTYGTR